MKDTDKKDNFYPTRQTLLLRVKDKHDEKSWEEFVFYYEKFIYIICRKFGLSHHDCEELTQKIMLKLWKKVPEYEYTEGSRFRGWLYTITNYAVKDFYKSHYRSEARKEKALDYEIWNPSESSEKVLDDKIEKEWRKYISNLAFEKLSEKFSQKVLDIFMEHHKGAKVQFLSEKYDMPTNTIYIYVQRVTKKLSEEIKSLSRELD